MGQILGHLGVEVDRQDETLVLQARDAGLVEAQKQGKQVLYTVRYDLVTETLRGVADAVEACCPDDQCCK